MALDQYRAFDYKIMKGSTSSIAENTQWGKTSITDPAGDRPRVHAAFSAHGGQSFGQTNEVDGKNPTVRVGLA